MYSLGYIVTVINPLQIKSFAKAKLSRHKTDKVDSAIIAELPRIESFKSARQLAAFIGLTPKHHESVTSVHGRTKISKMGVGGLRKALFFPAMSAMRFNEYFKKFALKLKGRGKAKKSIICAIMRKLVHVIFGILKNREEFKMERLYTPNDSICFFCFVKILA